MVNDVLFVFFVFFMGIQWGYMANDTLECLDSHAGMSINHKHHLSNLAPVCVYIYIQCEAPQL